MTNKAKLKTKYPCTLEDPNIGIDLYGEWMACLCDVHGSECLQRN